MTENGAEATEKTERLDRRIDLDAARAARREKRGPAPSIVFLGEEWPLPHGLSADVLDLVGLVMGGDPVAVAGSISSLLGGDVYARLRARAAEAGEPLELDDLVFLLEEVLEVYGVTLPESEASAPPS